MSNDCILLNNLLNQLNEELAPEMKENEYFDFFANEQVLKNYELSYDEMQIGMVDNGGDGGIDGIHIFINGELLQEDTDLNIYKKDIKFDIFLIQSKNETGFSEDAILKLYNSAKDLFDLTTDLNKYKSLYNKELLKIIKLFRNSFLKLQSKFPILRFNYFYASKAEEVHPNVQAKVNLVEEEITKKFSNSIFSFEFLTARKLLNIARTKNTTSHLLKCTDVLSTTEMAYICLVSLKDYKNFITDNDGKIIKSLFDANVRDYQGSVAVNNNIKKSLNERVEGLNFWWLNNGITITAEKVVMAANTLTIEEPQVVNGCQTSFEIYNYLKDYSGVEGRKALIKVIQAPNEEIRMNIIKANNSQTQIPLASLRATDNIHRDIEDYLVSKGFYYERRKNYYKNLGKPISRIISVGYLAQIVEAVLLKKPEISRSRPSTLLKKDEDYKKIFNSKYSLDLYYNTILLSKRIEETMKSLGMSAGDILNTKFHVSMFIVSMETNNLNAGWKKLKELDVLKITDEKIIKSIEVVKQVFYSLGGNDKVAKNSNFTESIAKVLKDAIVEDEKEIQ